tara:strand:- start:9985 stop:10641 length:657 start_codon:yes stop_codon:yes gene_type:complete
MLLLIDCIKNLTIIYVYDKSLCYILGTKARWYQLHCFINFLITIEILPTVLDILIEPKNGYKLLDNDATNNMVLSMHIYHLFISNKIGLYDWLHHIIFVGFGVLPGMLYINSNQLYLHKIACSGIPGVIEYGSLVLYKNNKLSKINQKFINTIMYVYFRLPLCVFGATMNCLAYKNNLIKDPLWITLYVNFLLYLNGVVFTYLTFDSYGITKYMKTNE